MVEVKETKRLSFKIPSEDLDKIDYVYDILEAIKTQIDLTLLKDFWVRNIRTGDEISSQSFGEFLTLLDFFNSEDEYVVE